MFRRRMRSELKQTRTCLAILSLRREWRGWPTPLQMKAVKTIKQPNATYPSEKFGDFTKQVLAGAGC